MPELDFLTGCYGWRDQSDYPDDLPPDWQLCYYSNELRSVIIPASNWAHCDQQQLEQWLQDTDDGFRFVFELPVTDLTRQARLLEPPNTLEQRYAGFYQPPTQGLIQQSCSSFSGNGWTVWDPEQDAEFPETKTPVMALTSSDDLTFLKQAAIKLASHQDEMGTDVGLFINAGESSFAVAKQTKTLIELMGL